MWRPSNGIAPSLPPSFRSSSFAEWPAYVTLPLPHRSLPPPAQPAFFRPFLRISVHSRRLAVPPSSCPPFSLHPVRPRLTPPKASVRQRAFVFPHFPVLHFPVLHYLQIKNHFVPPMISSTRCPTTPCNAAHHRFPLARIERGQFSLVYCATRTTVSTATVHGPLLVYRGNGPDCRLSLRESGAAFAERKATLAARER
jgi:hypothetical protein